MTMPDKVKLLPEDRLSLMAESGAFPDEVNRLVALARWAAKARNLLKQLHWYPDARILLDEIDDTETPK